MELPSPYTCDVCGVHKGEQNHWFRVWRVVEVSIAPWSCLPPVEKHFHACGEEHALRKAAELLAGLKPASDKRTTPSNGETTAIQT
jgi:hypothetical protein